MLEKITYKQTSIGHVIGDVQNSNLNIIKMDNQGTPIVNWDYLDSLDWIQSLKDCPQDKIWHAEGNVYVHTQMVINNLYQLPEYQTLSLNEQIILLMAAIFHDVAKPICTLEENGRIISPKHAKVGEHLTRNILWDLDFESREMICSLVRLHGIPVWALENDNANAIVISASLRLKNHYLYLLSKADILGRICEDKADLLEKVEYFKELCIENNCYNNTYLFHNEHSKFKFFHKNENYTSSIFDDTSFRVIIMCGLPGSGKDSYIHKFLKDIPMISLDELRKEHNVKHGDRTGLGRIVAIAYEMAKRYAGQKKSFVWNATSLTSLLRNRLIQALLPYNPRFEIVYLETDFAKVLARRKEEIPAKELENMRKMLEMPMQNDTHEVQYFYS